MISGRDVIHLAPDGSQRVLLADPDACGYNDLATTREGDLLAGVLRYRPLAGEEPRSGALVRLRRDGELRVLSEEVVWPNGIGVSPDGQTVYVSDYARELVPLPASFVSSLCFGGPDLREVLISTADNELRPELGGTLLRARSELPGLLVGPASV